MKSNKLFTTRYSVVEMLKVLEGMDVSDTGSFYTYVGSRIKL